MRLLYVSTLYLKTKYTFLGREYNSPGIGKIEAEVYMSQEELFILRSDSCLAKVWQMSS